METKTLEILSKAISEIGSWQWWDSTKDLFQLEFCDVLLYLDLDNETDADIIQHLRLPTLKIGIEP